MVKLLKQTPKRKYAIFVAVILVIVATITTVFASSADTEIRLNFSKYSLSTGSSYTFKMLNLPADATVTWSVDNEDIISVNENGKVTSKKDGQAIVTACVNNTDNYSCNITVAPFNDIELNVQNTLMTINSNFQLSLLNVPTEQYDVEWISSDESIATVDTNGLITAHKEGDVNITSIVDGHFMNSCYVNIRDYSNTKLDYTNENIPLFSSFQLTVLNLPTENSTVKWKSMDETIASVTNTGIVIAIGEGNVEIQAEIDGIVTLSANFKIFDYRKIQVENKNEKFNLNSSVKVNLINLPDTQYIVQWYSSDENIGTVTQNGEVTTKSTGSFVVTSIVDGRYKNSCFIDVIDYSAISLDYTNIALIKDSSQQLQLLNLPPYDNTTIKWSSSNEDVARVSDEGNVITYAVGSATIWAMVDNKYTYSCVVNVYDYSKVQINVAEKTIIKGTTLQLSLSDLPQTDPYVMWQSTDSSIVSVDSNGLITANALGTATITATVDGIYKYTSTITVDDYSRVALNSTMVTMANNKNYQLSVSGLPNTNPSIWWWSDNPSVVDVDQNGLVTSYSVGKATIYALIDGTLNYGCVFDIDGTVTIINGNDANKSYSTLSVGQTIRLTSKGDVAKDNVIWTSSNPNIARANTNGFIDAVGEGECYIYAGTPGKTVMDQIKVVVTKEKPIITAYSTPNIAQNGVGLSLIVVTTPSENQLAMNYVNKNNELTYLGMWYSGYHDETVNGRTVRIWNVWTNGLNLDSSENERNFKLYVYTNHSTENFTFNAFVSRNADNTTPIVAKRNVSDNFFNFRSQYEGLCQTVVYDIVNIPTIGYGNAISVGEVFYNNQTSTEAMSNMVRETSAVFANELNIFTTREQIALTQSQFDALASFSYNYGAYSWRCYDFYLRQLLVQYKNGNNIDPTQLHYAFGRLSYTGGYFIEGLYRSRIDEWEMFINGDYNVHPYSDMTGNFKVPTAEQRADPNQYKGYFQWVGYRY